MDGTFKGQTPQLWLARRSSTTVHQRQRPQRTKKGTSRQHGMARKLKDDVGVLAASALQRKGADVDEGFTRPT